MPFKLDKSNFNFGKGTNHGASNSPTKIGWKAWMAGEGYYKAGKNIWDNYKKKKEQNAAAEKWAEQQKRREDFKKLQEDPNVDPRHKVIGGTANYGMVQVWDAKLGRNKWVSDMDAYYAKMKKEGKDPVSGQPIEHLEKVKKENEEKKKQEELKLEEENKEQKIPAKEVEVKDSKPKEEVVVEDSKKKNKKKNKKKKVRQFRYNF